MWCEQDQRRAEPGNKTNKNKKVLLRERKRHTARKRAQDADPPPQLDLTPPPPRRLDLTPPAAGPDPPPRCELTKWNYYLPVVLRTRAVTRAFSCNYRRSLYKGSQIHSKGWKSLFLLWCKDQVRCNITGFNIEWRDLKIEKQSYPQSCNVQESNIISSTARVIQSWHLVRNRFLAFFNKLALVVRRFMAKTDIGMEWCN